MEKLKSLISHQSHVPPADKYAHERAMWAAATAGNLSEVMRILKDHPNLDLNWADSDLDRTIFYRACGHGQAAIVEYLLTLPQVDVNIPNRDKCSPLWMAAHDGHIAVVKLLLASNRELDLNMKSAAGEVSWGGKDASTVARDSIRRERYGDEQEYEYQRSKMYGVAIADLIDEFKKDPQRVRWELRQEPLVRNQYIGDTFALVVFLSDSYVRLKEGPAAAKSEAQLRAARFLALAKGLPLDLQMVLCNRLYSSPKNTVLTRHSEPAFRRLAMAATWKR